MNLSELISTVSIEPGLQWAVLGPEARAFASNLGLKPENVLPHADAVGPTVQGLLLVGALSAETDPEAWLGQLLTQLPHGATLVVIEWQGDGPLDLGPDLTRRFKRGRLSRQLRQAGFSQIQLLVNQPVYYVLRAVKQNPAPSPQAGKFVPVARVDELPKNGMKAVELFGQAIIVANTGRGIVAFAQACPHAGTSLLRGKLKGQIVVCPLHYYMWHVGSGEPIEPPDEDILPRYPVRVDASTGIIEVALNSH